MEEAEICRYSFRCVVADEVSLPSLPSPPSSPSLQGHRLKNDRNVSYQVLAQFHSVYRVLVTGTPYQVRFFDPSSSPLPSLNSSENELKELWNLLNFIFPNVFGDAKSFEAFFAIGGSTQAEAAPLPGRPLPLSFPSSPAHVPQSPLPSTPSSFTSFTFASCSSFAPCADSRPRSCPTSRRRPSTSSTASSRRSRPRSSPFASPSPPSPCPHLPQAFPKKLDAHGMRKVSPHLLLSTPPWLTRLVPPEPHPPRFRSALAALQLGQAREP